MPKFPFWSVCQCLYEVGGFSAVIICLMSLHVYVQSVKLNFPSGTIIICQSVQKSIYPSIFWVVIMGRSVLLGANTHTHKHVLKCLVGNQNVCMGVLLGSSIQLSNCLLASKTLYQSDLLEANAEGKMPFWGPKCVLNYPFGNPKACRNALLIAKTYVLVPFKQPKPAKKAFVEPECAPQCPLVSQDAVMIPVFLVCVFLI